MSIDKNSPEFKEALAEAVQLEINKIESGEKLKDLEEKISQANADKEELTNKVSEAEKAVAEKEKEFTEYKAEIQAKETALARWNSLVEKGFDFGEKEKDVKDAIAKMNDESFDFYLNSLVMTKEAEAKKVVKPADQNQDMKNLTPEQKKKLEEEKKKKMAKASNDDKDPVVESDVALANKVDNDKVKEKFTAIDKVVKTALGLK